VAYDLTKYGHFANTMTQTFLQDNQTLLPLCEEFSAYELRIEVPLLPLCEEFSAYELRIEVPHCITIT